MMTRPPSIYLKWGEELLGPWQALPLRLQGAWLLLASEVEHLQRRRARDFPCIVPGCEGKADPWDRPFCRQHGWDDYEAAMH